MRIAPVVIITVALLLIGCNGAGEPTPDVEPENTPVVTPEVTEPPANGVPPTRESPQNTLVETSEYRGVIVSEAGASEFAFLFDGATIFWEPSIDDISSAEERIRQYIVSVQNNPNLDSYQQGNLDFIVDNLGKYRRQYVGIVVGGEKRIWCNAFFSDHPYPDWERVPVYVMDGGRNYWQIEYDLLKDECINFYVHGEA